MIVAPRQLDTCGKLPDTFTLFPVLSFQVRLCMIKVSLPSLYPDAAHVRKNTRLSLPAQLQCLCSGAEEWSNKATGHHRQKLPYLECNDALTMCTTSPKEVRQGWLLCRDSHLNRNAEATVYGGTYGMNQIANAW